LRAAFKMFDKDGSGKIDASEIGALLSGEEFRDVYTLAQLQAAIREVDENGDGEIDFEEFIVMMKSLE
jgi:Ca2+-binding EF-hand superfamily protein